MSTLSKLLAEAKSKKNQDELENLRYKLQFQKFDINRIKAWLSRNLEELEEGTFDLKEFQIEAFEMAFYSKPRESNGLHPSEISKEHCRRFWYYRMSKHKIDADFIPFTDDNRMKRLVDLGTIMHLYIQMNLKKAGLLEDFEVPISKTFSGHADGTIFYKEREAILEIKTINTFQFSKLQAPLPEHANQATIYAKSLGVLWILFIYYDKNTSAMKHYLVRANTTWWRNLTKKVAAVSTLRLKNTFKHGKDINLHTLPDRACAARHTEKAMKCPFVNTCFDDKNSNPQKSN